MRKPRTVTINILNNNGELIKTIQRKIIEKWNVVLDGKWHTLLEFCRYRGRLVLIVRGEGCEYILEKGRNWDEIKKKNDIYSILRPGELEKVTKMS